MHFLRPYFLCLFIPFAGLIFYFFRSLSATHLWENICSKELMPYVLVKKTKSKKLKILTSSFVLSLLILAASGPTWEKMEEPIFKRSHGLVIVLDLSEAMNAEDIKPSRLKRALYKISDLLNQKKEGQTALIVFSEKPFVVTPLTEDVATILAQLPVLETKIMPSAGHQVDQAIEKAIALLKQTGIEEGSILLVTSTLSSDELKKSAKILNNSDVSLFVLAVGKEELVPIAKEGGGFVKDKKGALLMTGLQSQNLKKLANDNGGFYTTLSIDDSDLNAFEIKSKRVQTDSSLKVDKWQDQGFFLVLLTLPFFSLIFRKGVLSCLLLFPYIGEASIWTEKQAEDLFILGNYEEAKELFEDPNWKGCAHYQLKEYDLAAENFAKDPSVKGLYNYGTAKAKAHDYESALQAYAEVLKIDPEHEDALYNKKLIEEHKKENSQNQNSNDQNQEKQDPSDDQTGDKDKEDEEKSEEEPNDKKDQEVENKTEEKTEDERQKEMDERTLMRVPDDPGGLLRRKFLQQYRQGMTK